MNIQDKNAGNLGDLLKHFWLLELVTKVLKTKPQKVAYIESHAGAGIYQIAKTRIKEIGRNRSKIDPDPKRWQDFDRLQSRLSRGYYLGSFALVFNLLKKMSDQPVRGKLWEKDDEANQRIWQNRDTLIPFERSSIVVRKKESNPMSFRRACQRFTKEGYSVIWLCDPFWGRHKVEDRAWTGLLNLKDTYGLIFACCAGDSRKRGPAKFDYAKVTGLDSPPDHRIDDRIRSYALYFTPAVRSLLSDGRHTP